MTAYGALPFNSVGQLKTRPDTVLEEALPLSVWPVGSRITRAGVTYDHQGEAPLEFYAQLSGVNRVLVFQDEEYVVVDAQRNIYLPHTALVLRRSRAAGA